MTADASGAHGEHVAVTRTAVLPTTVASPEARAVATALGHAAAEALLEAGAGEFLVR